ncbi:efflux RND transporter periplasmic adaptor subunit [Hydrogenophaga sp. 5NK40-0174]|uniref:efflux RND transporter periplasmic adaptor subunit n=1 Tax=Hydrogenophaga sp. 5NK40-0174 TaxID=3127649 RepID=UPI003101C489
MATQDTSTTNDLKGLLGDDHPPRWWQRRSLWVGLLVLALLALGIAWWGSNSASKAAPAYVTQEAQRGKITLTVAANGTLQPTRSVNIGSELSGTVRQVFVDVNDEVKAGQVLVVLDTAKLKDQVNSSRAALASAVAQQAQATATRTEAAATLARYEEVARLSGGKVPSEAELDSARAAADRATAAEASAQAAVEKARAALSTDETNLSKASIKSPIDGVVLARSVDPGNAVAASLQAVTLLTVAEDLTKLQLDVNVDEADVGSVKTGQRATFTVSAYPSRQYPATIDRVAFGSTTTDNVVTYVTTLAVNNDDMSLRPGMTASATIVAKERADALLVPNTALRFAPSQVNDKAAGESESVMSKLMPRPPRRSANKTAGEQPQAPGERTLWVLRDGAPQQVKVTTGISDGRKTEITGGELQPGMAVITEQRSNGS